MNLAEIISVLEGLPEKDRSELVSDALEATRDQLFTPSPGPQTDAYFSKADILLFGGEPGGGKTGLLIGLALNEHKRSLIVRKQFSDVEGVIDNAKDMIGDTSGFVGGGRPRYTAPNGSLIHFQGMAHGDDFDTSKQGTPHDFIGVDEGAQMPESSIRMLLGWNRTKELGQRCRMVIATNPPVDVVGDWMAAFFAPWLDPAHHNPAEYGELRWFVIGPDGESIEVGSSDPVDLEGKEYYPHSRTYINSKLEDNPFIDAEDYRRRLQAMPEPYRTMLTSGNFLLARKDLDFQVIPTAWVIAAQARWKPDGANGYAMTAMAFDPAGGGRDSAEIACRYGGWYAPLISEVGESTADGSKSAGTIISYRRDNCPVIVDVGGGYGGSVMMRLEDNGIKAAHFNGVNTSLAKTRDGKLSFANKRAEAFWRLREELDPDQENGSCIALPPDAELRSDLCAPTWKLSSKGIQIESKKEIRKRIGRSTGKGDAVMMALSPGNQAIRRHHSLLGREPVAITSKSAKRQRRR